MANDTPLMATVSSLLAVVFGIAGFSGFNLGTVPTGVFGNLSVIFILQTLSAFAAVYWLSDEFLQGHHVSVIEYGIGGLVGFTALSFAGIASLGGFSGWEGIVTGALAGIAGVVAHEVRGNFLGGSSGSSSSRSRSRSSSSSTSSSSSGDEDVVRRLEEVEEEEEEVVQRTEEEEGQEEQDVQLYEEALDDDGFKQNMERLVADEEKHEEDAEKKAKKVEQIIEKVESLSGDHKKIVNALNAVSEQSGPKDSHDHLGNAIESGNAKRVKQILNDHLGGDAKIEAEKDLKKAAQETAEILELEEEAVELMNEQIQDKKKVLEEKKDQVHKVSRRAKEDSGIDSHVDEKVAERLGQEVKEVEKDIQELEHAEKILAETVEWEEHEEARLQRIANMF